MTQDSIDAAGFREACRHAGRLAEALGLGDYGHSIGEIVDTAIDRLAARADATQQADALRSMAETFRTDAAAAWSGPWVTTGEHVAELAATWCLDAADEMAAAPAPEAAATEDEPRRALMTEPYDGHSDDETCPGCPHVSQPAAGVTEAVLALAEQMDGDTRLFAKIEERILNGKAGAADDVQDMAVAWLRAAVGGATEGKGGADDA